MFGYIVFNKPELKFREFEEYRSCYCGVCRKLRKNSGFMGQLALNYDVTFLTLLFTGLYEPETVIRKVRCIIHPFKRRCIIDNKFSEYSADMGLLLVYYKCIDDWKDDRKLSRYLYARFIRKKVGVIEKKYPDKCNVIKNMLDKLSEYEKNEVQNIDEVSGCFGNIMAEIFCFGNDIWEDSLRRFGFYMGKYIYLTDAYDDIFADIKSGSYNILRTMYDGIMIKYSDKNEAVEHFLDECRKLATMMITECAREFEKLPVIMYADIIRNILYSGVWCRFNEITAKIRKTYKKEEK